MQTTVLMATF